MCAQIDEKCQEIAAGEAANNSIPVPHYASLNNKHHAVSINVRPRDTQQVFTFDRKPQRNTQ